MFSEEGFNATGDFGAAVSYAMNFAAAFDDGQWLPRWITVARESTATSGTLDGTTPLMGSPSLIYYGFLQSALALPFLKAGVDPLVAVELTVFVSFAMAAWVLYWAARLLGVSGIAALAGAYAYLISPWLISNFYHRGGISESMGQAGLPFFVLAFAYLSVERRTQAAIWSAVGMAWVALGHNIFLLHSAVLCVLFTGVYVLLSSIRKHVSLVKRFEASWIIGGGVAIGLFAVAWQWYPAVVTLHEISFYYTGNLTTSAGIGGFADLTGALGWPQQFVKPEIGVVAPTDYYMTIGWWVLPAVALLLVRRTQWRLRVGLVVCFIWFFLLAYEPTEVTPYLPTVFGATQFAFRLLSYLSVIGALGVALAWPRMHLVGGVVLIGLMTAGVLPVLSHTMDLQRLPDDSYLGGYEYNAFYANSPRETGLRRWYDGWLDEENTISFAGGEATLRVRGGVDPRLGKTSMYLSSLDDEFTPVSNVAQVEDEFDVTLVKQGDLPVVRLMTAGTYDPTRNLVVAAPGLPPRQIVGYSVRPREVSLLPAATSSYVYADQMEIMAGTASWREFQCRPSACADRQPDGAGQYTLELPMVYNRFSVPTQDGRELPYASDFNHAILVKAPRLDAPIEVRYQVPALALVMTALGLGSALSLAALGIRGLRLRKARRESPGRAPVPTASPGILGS